MNRYLLGLLSIGLLLPVYATDVQARNWNVVGPDYQDCDAGDTCFVHGDMTHQATAWAYPGSTVYALDIGANVNAEGGTIYASSHGSVTIRSPNAVVYYEPGAWVHNGHGAKVYRCPSAATHTRPWDTSQCVPVTGTEPR